MNHSTHTVQFICEKGVKELVKELNCSRLAQMIARNSNRSSPSRKE